ncbi:MAG TPA: hypothetical protein VGG28_13245 [Kofleriaceae bacterium]|jgi:hypothetical protein
MKAAKTIVVALLAGVLGAGCMSNSGLGGDVADSQDTGPELVIPATGGPPVEAEPVGGDTYIPVTGGAPIVGTGT